MPTSRTLYRSMWVVTVIYWMMLFLATHLPSAKLPETHINDKIEHFTAYGLLGTLLSITLALRAKPRTFDVSVLVLMIGLAYGAIDEWLQALPIVHRDCELADWFADAAGIASAVVIVSILRALFRTKSL
jgi:VanZ family protein